MKEKDMLNPNMLGQYHRDIVVAVHVDRWHTRVYLSCGHTTEISRVSYNKYKDDATLCLACSQD